MTLARRRTIAVASVAFIAVYVSAYLAVRSQHWLVHRSGFDHGNTDNHHIAAGDWGRGGDVDQFRADVSYVLFTPLRWAETGFWYCRHPAGKPWPYAART